MYFTILLLLFLFLFVTFMLCIFFLMASILAAYFESWEQHVSFIY